MADFIQDVDLQELYVKSLIILKNQTVASPEDVWSDLAINLTTPQLMRGFLVASKIYASTIINSSMELGTCAHDIATVHTITLAFVAVYEQYDKAMKEGIR